MSYIYIPVRTVSGSYHPSKILSCANETTNIVTTRTDICNPLGLHLDIFLLSAIVKFGRLQQFELQRSHLQSIWRCPYPVTVRNLSRYSRYLLENWHHNIKKEKIITHPIEKYLASVYYRVLRFQNHSGLRPDCNLCTSIFLNV